MTFLEKSVLFAKLSSIAYMDEKDVKKAVRKLDLQLLNFMKKMAHKHIAL